MWGGSGFGRKKNVTVKRFIFEPTIFNQPAMRKITPKPSNRMLIEQLTKDLERKQMRAYCSEVDTPEFKAWFTALNKLRSFLQEMKRTNAKWDDREE